MKKFYVVAFVLICGFNLFAQTSTKVSPLPGDIAKWKKQDSNKLLKHPAIKSRLKKLLGKKNFEKFSESWETINPIVRKGDFLFSGGCLIHACGHIEAAIAIDLVNQTLHIGIFREGEKTKFFNEKKRKTPQVIVKWSKRLNENLSKKMSVRDKSNKMLNEYLPTKYIKKTKISNNLPLFDQFSVFFSCQFGSFVG